MKSEPDKWYFLSSCGDAFKKNANVSCSDKPPPQNMRTDLPMVQIREPEGRTNGSEQHRLLSNNKLNVEVKFIRKGAEQRCSERKVMQKKE